MKNLTCSTTLKTDQEFVYELILSKKVIEKIKSPLINHEGLKSVIKMYCCTCNSVFSLGKYRLTERALLLSDKQFEQLIKALDDIDNVHKKYYLHAFSCPNCKDEDKDNPKIEFRKIPKL